MSPLNAFALGIFCGTLVLITWAPFTSWLFSIIKIRTAMAELFTITIIGAVMGGFLSGGSYWLQNKMEEAEKERVAKKAAEDKRKLSPNLSIRIFLDIAEVQGPYHPPLKRYHLFMENLNRDSVPIVNLRMEFNFKHVIEQVHSQVVLPEIGGGATLSGRERTIKKKDGSEEYLREEPHNIAIGKKFSFEIETININKVSENLNFVDLYVEKWDERGSSFIAEIVIDTSKQPRIDKKLGEMGSFKGSYSYEIAGQQYSEPLHGKIPDEPTGWTTYTIPLPRKNPDEPGSRSY